MDVSERDELRTLAVGLLQQLQKHMDQADYRADLDDVQRAERIAAIVRQMHNDKATD